MPVNTLRPVVRREIASLSGPSSTALPDVLAPPPSPRQIALSLAEQTALWRPLVRFTEPRYFTRLSVGPSWEAWLLTWLPGQSTQLHDHGGSAGAFAVLSGLIDESLPVDGNLETRRYRAGSVRAFGSDHVHDVAARTRRRAVTLHVYTPRLTEMSRYALADGRLVRTCVEKAGDDW
jgi:quercetin dioxygenase-like cupin family protein